MAVWAQNMTKIIYNIIYNKIQILIKWTEPNEQGMINFILQRQSRDQKKQKEIAKGSKNGKCC